jgi:hypothetical protein
MVITGSGIVAVLLLLILIWAVYGLISRFWPEPSGQLKPALFYIACIATLLILLVWLLGVFGIATPIQIHK